MARIQRRRRARCRLPCQIVPHRGNPADAEVVTLSEGGLAVVTALALGQGDAVELRISSRGGARPIHVSALVWNAQAVRDAADTRLWRLGCVVSEPPAGFLRLVDRFAPPRRAARERPRAVPVAVPRREAPETAGEGRAAPAEADLPRRRDLEPPPKPLPEERLPRFQVRVKQVGGPRTRLLTVRARSATDAQQRAMAELERACGDATGWGVLGIARVDAGG